MKTIKIFLVSSNELLEERESISIFVLQENKRLFNEGISFELVVWEELLHSFTPVGTIQKYFNNEMLKCEIVIVLFYKKVGQFTKEEFTIAYKNLKDGNNPKYMFVFFKDVNTPFNRMDDELVKIYELKKEIEKNGQLYDTFSFANDLILKLKNQINLIVTASTSNDLNYELANYIQHVYTKYQRIEVYNPLSIQIAPYIEKVFIDLNAEYFRQVEEEDSLQNSLKNQINDSALSSCRRIELKVTGSLTNAINENDSAIIIGESGTGKTTFLKYLTVIHSKALISSNEKIETLSIKPRIPILIILKEFSDYLNSKKNISERCVEFINYFNNYLADYDCGVSKKFILSYLKKGQCIVMFDGLDEVTNYLESIKISKIISDVNRHYPKNQYIMTSRPVSYNILNKVVFNNVKRIKIKFLDDNSIEKFIEKWAKQIEGNNSTERLNISKFIEEIKNNPSTYDLCTNPFALGLILILQYSQSENITRTELYYKYIETFIMNDCSDIQIDCFNIDDIYTLLGYIAFQMHMNKTNKVNIKSIKDYIKEYIRNSDSNYTDERTYEAIIKGLINRNGLFTKKSEFYKFIHTNFQEYLTAKYCIASNNTKRILLSKITDEFWHSSITLAAEILSHYSEEEYKIFIEQILDNKYDQDNNLSHIILASKCICEIKSNNNILNKKIQKKLLKSITDKDLSIYTRRTIGELLGKIGDPRIMCEVPIMIPIEKGEFLMGSTDEEIENAINVGAEERLSKWNVQYPEETHRILESLYKREPLQTKLILKKFEISKYPITNQQYKYFIDDTRHSPPNLDYDWAKQYNWNDYMYPNGKANHPVVLIEYSDAILYCKWLSEKTNKIFRLPTEAEWEKSARYTDGRVYPWGNELNEKYCNINSSGFGHTLPVGLYEEGKSKYGAMDMIGNVWEWCSAIHDLPCEDREPLSRKYKYIVKGGSWSTDRSRTRCSYRTIDVPGTRNLLSVGFRIVRCLEDDY